MIRFWITCLVAWFSLSVFCPSAAARDHCAVCQKRFGSQVYSIKKLGTEEKLLICPDCAKLETSCYLCGVPVKDKYTQLADGRLLCETDTKQAVLEQDEAAKIFEDVKRDAQTILARLGKLPHRNIQLILEAKPKLDKTGGNIISRHEDSLLMGLTRTTRDGEEFRHSIYLLHGLTRDRLAVVAAHEYGHAWLHENVSRKLNQDAVEGFCDWLAYQVIKNKSMPGEMKVLLESTYSQGQLQAFVAAEKEHSFYRVMQWVKSGIEPEVDTRHLERILQLREPANEEPEPAFAFANVSPAPPRPALTNLVLKGLSGSKARRFALINDGTFALNEQGKVRLGTSNVVITCKEIRDDAVVIHVTGESAPRILALEKAK
jgi:hypothetical protein